MSVRGNRLSTQRSQRLNGDQFWVRTSPADGFEASSTFSRRSNNGFVPSAVAAENVSMERRHSSKVRHAEVYAYHRRLDNCLMASVTILSLLATLTVIGLVAWAVVSARQEEQDVYRSAFGPGGSNTFQPNSDAVLSARSSSPSAQSVSSAEQLSAIMQSLWDLDTGRLSSHNFQVNLQNAISSKLFEDHAPQRLFSSLKPSLETFSPTFRTFVNLQNDFIAETRTEDPLHTDKQEDIDEFLDAVLQTNVSKAAHSFLADVGAVDQNIDSLRTLLNQMWFEPYSRSKKYTEKDSSGFEHVFVGETRGEKVIGFHNWIRLYLEERHSDNLNYHGYVKESTHSIVAIQFSWLGRRKHLGSFFIGTSPEFELFAYTICFVLSPGKRCTFSVDDTLMSIQTYDMTAIPGLQIGSAYPVAL